MGDFADHAELEPYDSDRPSDTIRAGSYQGRQPVTCRNCGAEDLWWRQTRGGWRLATTLMGGELHVCPVRDDEPAVAPIEEPCSACGSEGRVYRDTGRYDDQGPIINDYGPCEVCGGTGRESIVGEPIDEADCWGAR